MTALLQRVGLALGGEPGARLAAPLGCPTSARTLLRLVRAYPDPPASTPQIVRIDDFAFRKGHTYGTILVNLETGRPLDLLPDRDSASVAAWLRDHPTITVITRDRADAYASGATQGAPQATQVRDRWHLLHNLSETVEEILPRLVPVLGQALAAALVQDQGRFWRMRRSMVDWAMKLPIFVRPLTDAEFAALEQGCHSPDAFTLRRCQILLASAEAQPPPVIAIHLAL